MGPLTAYASLFAASAMEATVVPIRSEVVLIGLLYAERYSTLLLLLVAILGNTLGAIVNWFLGRFISRFEDRSWFPVKREAVTRAEAWYHRYGRWTLLLSWLPVIGDVLTIAAGVLREPLPSFILLVGIAKTLRYAAVAAIAFGWFELRL